MQCNNREDREYPYDDEFGCASAKASIGVLEEGALVEEDRPRDVRDAGAQRVGIGDAVEERGEADLARDVEPKGADGAGQGGALQIGPGLGGRRRRREALVEGREDARVEPGGLEGRRQAGAKVG